MIKKQDIFVPADFLDPDSTYSFELELNFKKVDGVVVFTEDQLIKLLEEYRNHVLLNTHTWPWFMSQAPLIFNGSTSEYVKTLIS